MLLNGFIAYVFLQIKTSFIYCGKTNNGKSLKTEEGIIVYSLLATTFSAIPLMVFAAKDNNTNLGDDLLLALLFPLLEFFIILFVLITVRFGYFNLNKIGYYYPALVYNIPLALYYVYVIKEIFLK